ncbi:hypothetical protein MPH_11003 [Macrophomina phaseolina MS6]|uniref:Uncharacterized protein n=1 Tax=Macrophomina phaseolina (strain MS6) TaxID=1126212 RepID=K2QPK9_MACPH|nr:hypothetical protein MPH_11003 [Macrophomina phaseolina MS6]
MENHARNPNPDAPCEISEISCSGKDPLSSRERWAPNHLFLHVDCVQFVHACSVMLSSCGMFQSRLPEMLLSSLPTAVPTQRTAAAEIRRLEKRIGHFRSIHASTLTSRITGSASETFLRSIGSPGRRGRWFGLFQSFDGLPRSGHESSSWLVGFFFRQLSLRVVRI